MTCTLVASRLDGAPLAACFWTVAAAWIAFAVLTWRFAIVPWDEAPLEMLMRKNELRPLALLRRFPALVSWSDVLPSTTADDVDVDGVAVGVCAADRRRLVIVGRRRRSAACLAIAVCVVVGTYLAWSWSASGKVNTWPPAALIRGPRTELTWYDEWEPAVEAANATRAAMMVVFKASWCAPCRAMEYGPLASSEVVAAAMGVSGGGGAARATAAGMNGGASAATTTGGGNEGGGGTAIPLGAPPIVAVRLDCTKGTMPGAKLKRDVWNIAATPATAFAFAADVAAAADPWAVRPSMVLEHYQGGGAGQGLNPPAVTLSFESVSRQSCSLNPRSSSHKSIWVIRL